MEPKRFLAQSAAIGSSRNVCVDRSTRSLLPTQSTKQEDQIAKREELSIASDE